MSINLKDACSQKKILYGDQWNKLFSFAYSREPIDRCLSMFYYLYYIDNRSFIALLKNIYKGYKYSNKIGISMSFSFDIFLDLVDFTFSSDSHFSPVDLHFSSHVARMWDDVTDNNDKIILSEIYRLEDLIKGLDRVASICNFKLNKKENLMLNKSIKKKQFNPTAAQIKKIKKLYQKDFINYENKCHQFL